MKPILFLIHKFSLLTLIILIILTIVFFAVLFFLLRKKYHSVKQLRADLSGYFIFICVLLLLLFYFGPFPIRIYGVAVAIGFLSAVYVTSRLSKKQGINPAVIFDLGIYILIGTTIGARIFYIIFYDWSYFIENPLKLFAVWEGGLVFYGGLIGGIIGGVYFVKRHNLNVLQLADASAVGVAIGYFFGRLGCLGYGCCFGAIAPESFPFKIHFPAIGHPLTGYTPAFESHMHQGLIQATDKFSLFVYPTQIMESLFGLLLFFLLLIIYRHKKFNGQIAGLFLMLYALIRFLIEFLRVEPRFLGISTSQWIGFFIFSTGLWLYQFSKKSSQA